VNECADFHNGEGCAYRCRNIAGGFFCQCPADGTPTPSAFCVGTVSDYMATRRLIPFRPSDL